VGTDASAKKESRNATSKALGTEGTGSGAGAKGRVSARAVGRRGTAKKA